MKMLVVEDSPDVMETIRLCVSMRWPDSQVISATGGVGALGMVKMETPDIVVLDLGLPDMDGLEVLQRLRMTTDIPVIIVTARGEETSRVKGLELGADDYVVKPFSHTEFLARVNAVMRRGDRPLKGTRQTVYRGNGITIDLPGHRLVVKGDNVGLTPTEWSLLACLANSEGKVVTHDQLAEQVWGSQYLDQAAIKMAIRRLRRKLNDAAGQTVRSHRGIGYSLDLSA
ncbi:MAG: response regulator transcription factor [Chloroflexi bacterium]|nr:response regulator transcription factor [Chloroflexota bacterium]